VAVIGTVVSTVAAVSVSAAFADDAHEARTLHIGVGSESPDMALQVNAFLPGPLEVNVGDTVNWRIESTEFHTITFLSGAPLERFDAATPDGQGLMINPTAAFPIGGSSYNGTGIASSGLLNKNQDWSLTFTEPGTYEYVCLVHPGMKSEIHVAGAEKVVDGPVASVTVGVGDDNVSVMRFAPGDLQIHVGESVAFANHDTGMMPHTVSFRGDSPVLDVVVPQPQPDGPPLLVFNPAVFGPSGNARAFDGQEYLNSGVLMQGAPGEPFSVTFTQPGTYEYVCLLHENMGMKGTITVLP
jgi:plastocyanin